MLRKAPTKMKRGSAFEAFDHRPVGDEVFLVVALAGLGRIGTEVVAGDDQDAGRLGHGLSRR